jgi:hypothetical protein
LRLRTVALAIAWMLLVPGTVRPATPPDGRGDGGISAGAAVAVGAGAAGLVLALTRVPPVREHRPRHPVVPGDLEALRAFEGPCRIRFRPIEVPSGVATRYSVRRHVEGTLLDIDSENVTVV